MFHGVRDFTQEKFNQLENKLKQKDEADKQFFYGYKNIFLNSEYKESEVGIDYYIDDIMRAKANIDNENQEDKKNIETIFKNIANVDTTYSNKINRDIQMSDHLLRQIKSLTSAITPNSVSAEPLASKDFIKNLNANTQAFTMEKVTLYKDRMYRLNENGSYTIDYDYIEEFMYKDSISAEEIQAMVSLLYILKSDDFKTMQRIICMAYTDVDKKTLKTLKDSDWLMEEDGLTQVRISKNFATAIRNFCDETKALVPLYVQNSSDPNKDKYIYQLGEQISKAGMLKSILEYGSIISVPHVELYNRNTNKIKIDFNKIKKDGLDEFPIKIELLPTKEGDEKDVFPGYKLKIMQVYGSESSKWSNRRKTEGEIDITL